MALDHLPPNARLARELEQVAREAERVADTLRGINLMPRKFPGEAVEQICISLANLRHGTAEGCHEPLNFARYMLPLVRKDHFHIEGEEPSPEGEEDVYFTREHPLDQAIMRLYAAVGTALDEYRSQAQDQYDDHVGAEETVELGRDGTFSSIDQQSTEVARKAEEARGNLSEMAEPSSALAGNLGRQIQDGANLAHSVQSQIRIRPIVLRWYKSANAALRKLPDVMIRTADAMRVGTDVAKIWLEEWSAFNKRLRNLAYDSMHGLANALEATAERLKRQSRADASPVEGQRDPEVVAAEERVKALLLAGKELPDELVPLVETLSFKGGEGRIRRLDDLSRLENLRSLVAGNSLQHLTDFSALGALVNLTSLRVNANSATDLSALGQLVNLTSLAVGANSATDLSALGQLVNLTSLTVVANSATDLSALGQLANLTSLSVHAHSASDLSALGQLVNLTNLTVQAHSATDLSALGGLVNLTKLSLAAAMPDLKAIQALPVLVELTISTAGGVDLALLAGMKSLKKLRLGNVRFRNLALLQGVEVEIVGNSQEMT